MKSKLKLKPKKRLQQQELRFLNLIFLILTFMKTTKATRCYG